MIENRRHKRVQVSFFLKINRDDFETVHGHIIDISTSGCRVLSDRQVDADFEYSLTIEIPAKYEIESPLELNAVCVWSRLLEDSGAFSCGFQMVDVPQEKQAMIDKLLAALTGE